MICVLIGFPVTLLRMSCQFAIEESDNRSLREKTVSLDAASSTRRCFLHCWVTAPVVLRSFAAISSGERLFPIIFSSRARSFLVQGRIWRLLALGSVLLSGADLT